jgi:DNA-formamidopyrimidine glycosylase
MPEGPEVRRMSQDLARVVSEKTLVGINVISGRYTKKDIKGLTEINRELPTKIIGAGCHGKFIYVLTSSGHNIWNTLGMTGRWTNQRTKHSRIELQTEGEKSIYFEDVRNFGTLKVVYGKNALIKKLKSLGPDLLADDIDEEFFVARLREKNDKNITKVIMDQKVFSGVGNYVKAEALWLSEIDPKHDVEDISDKKLTILCKAIKNVLRESYNTGGATFKTHKNFSGELGDYSHRFLCYGRKVDAEGNKVEKIQTPDGRTTHWSPSKQGEKNESNK